MRILRNLLPFVLVPVAGLAAQVPAPDPSGPPTLKLELASLTPEATVVMGGDRRLTGTDEAVWVVDRTAGTITRVETKGNKAGTPVVIGKQVCAEPLVAFKSVWVAECGAPALARMDLEAAKPPVMLTATIRGVGPVVSGVGSVWMVADPAGTILRLDPDTNRAVAEIPVPGGAQALAFAEGAVWVAGTTQATVTRINAHTNVVGNTTKVGKGPLALAAGEGALWVLNTGDGTVSRVDTKSSKVSTTITLGVSTPGGAIVAGEHGVWVSAPGAPLVRIDPVTNHVSHVFSGPGGGAITIAAGSVWLPATPTDVWRIDPKRVEATRRFDPAPAPQEKQLAVDGVPVDADGNPQYSTFSLCAVDPATQQSGAAVTTRVPFVGRAVPHVRAGVGAVCTQASTRVENGREGLDLMARGVAPSDALAQLLAPDEQRESRQVGLIDMQGRTAAHTGKQNGAWAGSRQGVNYTVQANIMVGPEVIEAVANTFEASAGTGMPLAERMILAMEAGQAKGGDRRWGLLQSAAIKIADPNTPGRGGDNIALAIEVGEHAEPVAELKRIYYTTARRLGYRSFSRIDGPDVIELKRMLHALGYWRPTLETFPANAPAREYGLFDDEAIAAVDKFRADNGMVYQGNPAGLVDARFIDALRAAYFKKRKG